MAHLSCELIKRDLSWVLSIIHIPFFFFIFSANAMITQSQLWWLGNNCSMYCSARGSILAYTDEEQSFSMNNVYDSQGFGFSYKQKEETIIISQSDFLYKDMKSLVSKSMENFLTS